MSLAFLETCADGTWGLWDAIRINTSDNLLALATGISGMPAYCIDLTNTNGTGGFGGGGGLRAALPPRADYYFSLLWRPTGQLDYDDIISVCDNDTIALEVLTFNDGSMSAYKQNSQLSHPATICWVINTTYLIEVYFKIASSGGRVVVKVNGTTIVDYTGDTSIGSTNKINKFWIGRTTQAWFQNQSRAYFGNIAASPDGWIGTPNKSMLINTRNQKLSRLSSNKIVRV